MRSCRQRSGLVRGRSTVGKHLSAFGPCHAPVRACRLLRDRCLLRARPQPIDPGTILLVDAGPQAWPALHLRREAVAQTSNITAQIMADLELWAYFNDICVCCERPAGTESED